MKNYSRQLDSAEAVEDFLDRVLKFDYSKLRKIVPMIVNGEIGVAKFDSNSRTISSEAMRDKKYKTEEKRWDLREQILNELFTLPRLDDDDKIRLTIGGALPQVPLRSESEAFILIGLPASGKSGVAADISDSYGAVILDSDFAKRKLPEFKDYSYGATLVHQESSEITYAFKSGNPRKLKSLYRMCVEAKHNLVIPTIGQNPVDIIDLAEALKNKDGYKVHLVLVFVRKKEATIRAIKRYHKSKRYVPLGLIFDWYGNDPSHSYYYLRCKRPSLFESFGVVSTENLPPEHTDLVGNSPVFRYKYVDFTLQLP